MNSWNTGIPNSEKSAFLMNDLINGLVIKKPSFENVTDIFALIDDYAEKGLLLSLSKDQIAKRLDSFTAGFINDEFVACVSLRNFGDNLFEIRSLAVNENYSGQGIGSKIVAYLLKELLETSKESQVFALTYQVSFFLKLGFQVVDKDIFPQKIWSDCSNCPKFSHCDEVAVLLKDNSLILSFL